MDNLFTIGELAKLFAINIRTLRFYDEIGLLKSEYINPQNNYRYYSTSQVERLNNIKYLRTLGMSTAQIKSFFDNMDATVLLEMLEAQKQATQKKIKELQSVEKKISKRMLQIADALQSPLDTIKLIHLGKRPIVLLQRNIKKGSDFEKDIRELELTNKLDSSVFLGKVGFIIDQASALENKLDEFSGIFILIEPEDITGQKVSYIPANDYLTIRFQGTHCEAQWHYQKLFKEIRENNYNVCGDIIEITIIDSGITNNSSQYVTELQIPIKSST